MTHGICVFLRTHYFADKNKLYNNSISHYFAETTDDTRKIIAAAKKSLQSIYQPGFRYKKAGIVLLNLTPKQIKQYDILSTEKQVETDYLMSTLDNINTHFGKPILFFAAEGIKRPWMVKCEKRTPRYTTHWDELAKVYL